MTQIQILNPTHATNPPPYTPTQLRRMRRRHLPQPNDERQTRTRSSPPFGLLPLQVQFRAQLVERAKTLVRPSSLHPLRSPFTHPAPYQAHAPAPPKTTPGLRPPKAVGPPRSIYWKWRRTMRIKWGRWCRRVRSLRRSRMIMCMGMRVRTSGRCLMRGGRGRMCTWGMLCEFLGFRLVVFLWGSRGREWIVLISASFWGVGNRRCRG